MPSDTPPIFATTRHITTAAPLRDQGANARDVDYDRETLLTVLVYHHRAGIKGCGCGWAELGRSWPEHVATVYEESVAARSGRPVAHTESRRDE